MNKRITQRGFTLLEMMIAIALSVIVAMMAYESFDAATRNAQRTRDVLGEINKLDRAWQIIGQDMRNAMKPLPPQVIFQAASMQTKGKDSFQVLMQFCRGGWINPMQRLRSDLQQVNYRIAEGKLWRDYIPERNVPLADIDFERQSLHQLLLDNVIDMQLRFLSEEKMKANGKSILEGSDYSNAWESTWPPLNPGGNQSLMPVAVEITIEVEGVGRSVRLFALPR